ncbi:MAG: helix-turn-helix domain-containing protein [Pseudomonadota bacterium]
MTTDNPDQLLDRPTVATEFGISRRYLETAVHRGDGPRITRIGRLVRYRRSEVVRWIEAQTEPLAERVERTL